jgi:hypothetical protein
MPTAMSPDVRAAVACHAKPIRTAVPVVPTTYAILPADVCSRSATISIHDCRVAIAARYATSTTADADTAVIAPVLREMRASVKEGTPDVVVVPIVSEHKRDDRHVDLVHIVGEINVSIAVEVIEECGPDPAAISMPRHVTPIAAAEAAVNGQVRATRHPGHSRVYGRRPGPHRYGRGRVASGGKRHCWCRNHEQGSDR